MYISWSSHYLISASRQIISASHLILSCPNLMLQTTHQTINEMPKIKPLQGQQLALDELLPEAPAIKHKPGKKPFKKQALYRVHL